MKSHARHSGYMVIDALAGLFLLVALASVLATALYLRNGTDLRVQNQRLSLQDAQSVLVGLQSTGGAKAAEITGAEVSVKHLGKLKDGAEWVEVKVSREGRSASLVGLIPTGGKP